MSTYIYMLLERLHFHVEPHVDPLPKRERNFLIDNLLVRIQCIIVMTRWTGLAIWVFEFSFAGSLTSTFLGQTHVMRL